jgi:hypothetical protein
MMKLAGKSFVNCQLEKYIEALEEVSFGLEPSVIEIRAPSGTHAEA